jgi:hypothetical protein
MIDFNTLIPAFSRREKEIFEFLEVPFIQLARHTGMDCR